MFKRTLLKTHFILIVVLFGISTIFGCSGDGGGDGDNDDTTDDDVTDDDSADDDTADDDAEAPTYPNNHKTSWDCYICHEESLMGVTTKEPHSRQYASPTECINCHQMGNWTNPYYAGGHNWSQNCLSCHANSHSKSWQEKDQCLVCHGEIKK